MKKSLLKLGLLTLMGFTVACGGNSSSTPTSSSSAGATTTSQSTGSSASSGASSSFNESIKTPVPVTEITLDETSKTLAVGESFTLTATVAPDDADDATVTWESSDTEVATVTDGVVKATNLKAGTATITAKAGECTATCAITVEDTARARHAIYLQSTQDASQMHVRGKLMGYEKYANSATANVYLQDGVYGYWLNNFPFAEDMVGKSYDIVAVGAKKAYLALNAKGATISELNEEIEATPLTLGETENSFEDSCGAAVTCENVTVKTLDADKATFTFELNGEEYTAACNTATETGASVKEKIATMAVGQKVTSILGRWGGGSTGYGEKHIVISDAASLVYEFSPATSVAVSSEDDITSIAKGQTLQLSAVVSPVSADSRVTWASSETAVATVDETGLVTAVGAGTTVITASSATEGVNGTFTLNVTEEAVAPESISLRSEKDTVYIGKTLEISVELNPVTADPGLTWTSSDETKATVVDGVVTGVAEGTVTITATSLKNPEISGTIALTVAEAPVIESVSYDFTSIPSGNNELKAADLKQYFDTTVQNGESIVTEVTAISKMYPANNTQGPKLTGLKSGTGSAVGSFTVTTSVAVKSIVINCSAWGASTKDTVSVNDSDPVVAGPAEYQELTFDLGEGASTIKFDFNKRVIIGNITFNV